MADSSLVSRIRDLINRSPNVKDYSEVEGHLLSVNPKTVITFRVDFYTKQDAEAFANSVRPLVLDSKVAVGRTGSGLFQVQFDP